MGFGLGFGVGCGGKESLLRGALLAVLRLLGAGSSVLITCRLVARGTWGVRTRGRWVLGHDGGECWDTWGVGVATRGGGGNY